MIDFAKAATETEFHPKIPDSEQLSFKVCDYELPFELGQFDVAVIYDALHHAEDEGSVIRNVLGALKRGGISLRWSLAEDIRRRHIPSKRCNDLV